MKFAVLVKIKSGAIAKLPKVRPRLSADAMTRFVKLKNQVATRGKIIAVGTSTRGTTAIRIFSESLPADSYGIVIKQHIP